MPAKTLKPPPLCHAGMPFGPSAPVAIRNQVAGSAPSAVHKTLSEEAGHSPQQKAATTERQRTNGMSSPSEGASGRHLDSIGEVSGPGQQAGGDLSNGTPGQAGRRETSGGRVAGQLAQSLMAVPRCDSATSLVRCQKQIVGPGLGTLDEMPVWCVPKYPGCSWGMIRTLRELTLLSTSGFANKVDVVTLCLCF